MFFSNKLNILNSTLLFFRGQKDQNYTIELPIKLSDKFTLTPIYRYYTQKKSKYFFQKTFYTPLSPFTISHQLAEKIHFFGNTKFHKNPKIF